MKRKLITATAVTLLAVGMAFAADQSAPGGGAGIPGTLEGNVKTADATSAAKPELLAAVETDPRVQADGNGWRLDKASVTDPKRPRVLLIGDSILNGYMPFVTKALAGKIYVDGWMNPNWQSERYNKMLAQVLTNGPYDVVHFNIGLHGWQPGRIKEGTFEPLTKAFVEVIRQKCPNAKIIWASTTPVRVKGQTTELNPVINANIIEQNRMAAKVMAEMHVPVDDFYALLLNKLNLGRGDGFHWTAPAYKVLAHACVNSIFQALPANVH
jgi:hypothetical protein